MGDAAGALEAVAERYNATVKKLQSLGETLAGAPDERTREQRVTLERAVATARRATEQSAYPDPAVMEDMIRSMERTHAEVVARRGYPMAALLPEVRAPSNVETVKHVGMYVDTFRWAQIESRAFAPETMFDPLALQHSGDRRIYNQGKWSGSINDPSSEPYWWERGWRKGGYYEMQTDSNDSPIFDEDGDPVLKEAQYYHRYNPMHTYADNSGRAVRNQFGDEANPKDRWAWRPLTEEKKCFYWAYKLKNLFVRRELVTRERLTEVGHMVEALTVEAVIDVKKGSRLNNDAVGFLRDISQLGGLCELPGLSEAIDAAHEAHRAHQRFLKNVNADASYKDWKRLAAAADERASAIQTAHADKFWWYYLTCYCMIINEPHPGRSPSGVMASRADGLRSRAEYQFGYPPKVGAPDTRAEFGPLIAREGLLDLTTYRLQAWFAYHLADSPVTQLAYGIPESCGRLSKIAQFNPKLLRFSYDSSERDQFYFEKPNANAVEHSEEELQAMYSKIRLEAERAYALTGEKYQEEHPGEDEDGQIAARAREKAIQSSVRARDMLMLDIDKYDTGELIDLAEELPVASHPRLKQLQAAYRHAVKMHPRMLYVFGDTSATLNAQRYVPGKHDHHHDATTNYHILMLVDGTEHKTYKRGLKKFDLLLAKNRENVMPEPVVVDLYKPLPDPYSSMTADGTLGYNTAPRLARTLFKIQQDYWNAMNANPRFVYRQELRTYMFDPNVASPERLAEDCFYWSAAQNESVRQAQEEMQEAAKRYASGGDEREQRWWGNALVLNGKFYEQGRNESPPNRAIPDAPVPLRYETKLRLEASNWSAKDDDQRTDKNTDPEVPAFYVTLCGATLDNLCTEPYRAWTHFQVGQWYRDAEFHRTMYRVQKKLLVGPPANADWDYERYTTIENGREEADASEFEYERRLNVEERELDPEQYDDVAEQMLTWIGQLDDPKGEARRLSGNLHRRCPKRDLINWDVSFDARVTATGEAEAAAAAAAAEAAAAEAAAVEDRRDQNSDVSDSDSEADADEVGGQEDRWYENEVALERLYGREEPDTPVRQKPPPPPLKRRRSGSQTYLQQTKQRREDRAERAASVQKRRATREPERDVDEEMQRYRRELAAYEEENEPPMRRLERLKAQRVNSVVDDVFRSMRAHALAAS